MSIFVGNKEFNGGAINGKAVESVWVGSNQVWASAIKAPAFTTITKQEFINIMHLCQQGANIDFSSWNIGDLTNWKVREGCYLRLIHKFKPEDFTELATDFYRNSIGTTPKFVVAVDKVPNRTKGYQNAYIGMLEEFDSLDLEIQRVFDKVTYYADFTSDTGKKTVQLTAFSRTEVNDTNDPAYGIVFDYFKENAKNKRKMDPVGTANYYLLRNKATMVNRQSGDIQTTSTIARGLHWMACIGCNLLQPIGGRIFYDDGDNGAAYTFYDANMNVVNYDGTIASLANATQYIVSGAHIKDRFYVFDSTLKTSVQWGKFNTSIGITSDGIGLGKTNTATALQQTGWEDNSVFKYISDFNNNNETGCNDWYIGSKAEQEQLRAVASAVGIDWYGNRYVWSSVEDSAAYAFVWNYGISYWDYGIKTYDIADFACFAQRSF